MALYAVRCLQDDNIRLIKAPNKAQALRFVAESEYDIFIPTAEGAAALGAQGVIVEDSAKKGDDQHPDQLDLPMDKPSESDAE